MASSVLKNKSKTVQLEGAEKNNSTRLVQMRLRQKTINRINNIKAISGIDNRTQLVAIAIHLADVVYHAINEGGKVYIVDKKGESHKIQLIGM